MIFIASKYPYEEYHKTINDILYKKCAYHHEYFPEEDSWFPATTKYYYENKKNKTDGLYPECKLCSSAKFIKWTQDNRERHNEKNKKDRVENRWDVVNITRKNSEEQRKNGGQKRWQQNNPDKVRAYSKIKQHKRHNINKTEWQACKKYFNNCCAYCGLHIDEHYYTRNGIIKPGDFHKEHVDHEGENNLSNCIPSCGSCNDRKWKFTFDEWYNEDNEKYSKGRHDKIIQWLTEDYKQYIETPKSKGKYTRKAL